MSNRMFCLLIVPFSAYMAYRNVGIIRQSGGGLRWMHSFLAVAWSTNVVMAVAVATGLW